MSNISAQELSKITSFSSLVDLLRDKLDWPIGEDYGFEDVVYDWQASELGLKAEEIAKIREIHQLVPLKTDQPWGIFFLSLEEKKISVTVLRRMLRSLVVKKRQGAQASDRQSWQLHDLIFVTSFGLSGERELAISHFSDAKETGDLPILNVLGWNRQDTRLHNEYVAEMLSERLSWPEDPDNLDEWRKQWSSAFEIRLGAVIRTSKDLAVRLAALAGNIRARANELLAAETDEGRLRKMLEAFRKNLIQDLDEDGFADMFAQTISYGLLAAHISRPSGGLVADNLVDMVPRTNPFLRELFSTFLSLGGRDKRKAMDFDELGVRDVVDLLASEKTNMPAILRDFGDRNPKEDPVIHFYELFLTEYDPEKRMQRGVFYTPRPVVNFIVRGVDEVLREEFGLPLGLADTMTWGELAARNDAITLPVHIPPETPFVQILDPATGTGTFLVEVIDLIHKRMSEQWKAEGMREAEINAAWNTFVPKHLLPRLTGFELMMAPYAIAHMKIGLKLVETGYSFGSDERVRVFLTNALESARDLDMEFVFMAEALAHEATAANGAKSETPFTAIIGNPPYAGHSKNNKIKEIVSLVHDYKKDWPDLLKPGQGKWLQDDYVKFIRLSQHFIDRTGFGILGFVTNHSFFDNPTFKGMRSRLKDSFNQIRILDLHGNVKKKEKAPDGLPDGGVFEEVAQGVAITEAIKHPGNSFEDELWRDDLFGSVKEKLNYLVSLSSRIHGNIRCKIIPPECFFYSVDGALKAEWTGFERVPEIMGENGDPAPGIVSTHDQFAISFTDEEQIEKVEWLMATSSEKQARERFRLCTQEQWNYGTAKRRLLSVEWKKELVPLAYRPFDIRTTVYNNQVAVHLRDRVMSHMIGGENIGLMTGRAGAVIGDPEWNIVSVGNTVSEFNYFRRGGHYLFPIWLIPNIGENYRRPNMVRKYALSFGQVISLEYKDGVPRGEQTSPPDEPWNGNGDLTSTFGPRDLFDWIYAVLHSPGYRSRYAEFLKSDFPRIPIPNNRTTFQKLVPLGSELVALHLLKPDEAPVLEVPEVRFHGTGESRVAKGYPKYENGKVMINSTRWFEDVVRDTWEFHVGGYQVCEKWLKDRAGKGGRNPTDGRVLTDEDILHYCRTVTALTETRRVMTEIDKVIEEHGGWPDAFYVPPPPPPTIEEIIEADESRELEFKSTFQWDVRENEQNKELRKSVLKTLAAFMNSEGGTLVIGVTDDKEIHGLDDDLKLTKQTLDGFEQTLFNVFENAIGVGFVQFCPMRFADTADGKKVCVIEVEPSSEPAFLTFQGKQEFFIRRGNVTKSLEPSDQNDYIRKRFNNAVR